VDFSKTLAVLLDLVGDEVEVTMADRESVFVSGTFSGVLRKGEELLRGEFGAAEVVSFEVDGGGRIARFTLTNGDFAAATVEDDRLTIWEGGMEMTIQSSAHGKPLRQPHPFEDGLRSR
jgi:hypothetical protein